MKKWGHRQKVTLFFVCSMLLAGLIVTYFYRDIREYYWLSKGFVKYETQGGEVTVKAPPEGSDFLMVKRNRWQGYKWLIIVEPSETIPHRFGFVVHSVSKQAYTYEFEGCRLLEKQGEILRLDHRLENGDRAKKCRIRRFTGHDSYAVVKQGAVTTIFSCKFAERKACVGDMKLGNALLEVYGWENDISAWPAIEDRVAEVLEQNFTYYVHGKRK